MIPHDISVQYSCKDQEIRTLSDEIRALRVELVPGVWSGFEYQDSDLIVFVLEQYRDQLRHKIMMTTRGI